MSLDVYLTLAGAQQLQEPSPIWIREDGRTREVTQADWEARHPGRQPVIAQRASVTDRVYAANITHNLGRMAAAAGLYGVLWTPERCAITHAQSLILPLAIGLEILGQAPDYCQQFTPHNGWGTYPQLVTFVACYRQACQQYPSAEVSVWR